MNEFEDVKQPESSAGNQNVGTDFPPSPESNSGMSGMSEIETQNNGGSKIVKIIIALVVLVGVGAGSVFAYMQVNPFFLKSKEDIFKEMLVNTSDRISQGNFISDNNVKINIKDGYSELDFEVPFRISVSEIVENSMPNIGFTVDNLDTSPLVTYAVGGMMPVDGLDNNFGAELRLFDESVHFKVSSVPEILTMFLPLDEIVAKYENRWVSSSIEDIESTTGVEISNEESLTDEQMDYIIDSFSQAFITDAKPTIDSEKDGDYTKIIYSADFQTLLSAVELAIIDIDNYMGVSDSDFDAMQNDLESVNGTFKQSMYVDNSMVINRIENEMLLTDNTYDPPTNMNLYLNSNYDYRENVEIEVPNSDFTIDELMGDVMMMMFMGMDMGMEDSEMSDEEWDYYSDEEEFLYY